MTFSRLNLRGATARAEDDDDDASQIEYAEHATDLRVELGPEASEAALQARAAGIAETLRRGDSPRDAEFDLLYPYELRSVSGIYWTPLRVAVRAAQWIDDLRIGSIVDIGSGAGKFCVSVALATRCRVVGIEQRPRLVDGARELATLLGASETARFVEGTFGSCELPTADAYYVFNPFGENRFVEDERLDSDVELTHARFNRDVEAFELFLRDLPIGTHLLTYNGFGGRVPSCYRQIRVERNLPCVLRMWRKTSHASDDWRSPEAFFSMFDEGTERWNDDDEGDHHRE